MKYICYYFLIAFVFLIIDGLWLGVIADEFYQLYLGSVIPIRFRWQPALIFYSIYTAGILYFAVLPGLQKSNWKLSLLNGSILGFLCYSTYDLTNMAVIQDWPLIVTIADILWGIFITGFTALISFIIINKYLKSQFR